MADQAGDRAIGDAPTSATLRQAGIQRARAVIVAPPRDDTSVLITLTGREHNATATISAAVPNNFQHPTIRPTCRKKCPLCGQNFQHPRTCATLWKLSDPGYEPA